MEYKCSTFYFGIKFSSQRTGLLLLFCLFLALGFPVLGWETHRDLGVWGRQSFVLDKSSVSSVPSSGMGNSWVGVEPKEEGLSTI